MSVENRGESGAGGAGTSAAPPPQGVSLAPRSYGPTCAFVRLRVRALGCSADGSGCAGLVCCGVRLQGVSGRDLGVSWRHGLGFGVSSEEERP